jgi:hypothetical protein
LQYAVLERGSVPVYGFDTDPDFALTTARALDRRGLVVVATTGLIAIQAADRHRGRLYFVQRPDYSGR